MTIGKYWKRWSDPRLVICVLHNNDLNQVTWEMRAMEGDPEVRGVAGASPTSTTPRYAELVGLSGASGSTPPDDVGPAWEEALSADRPVVLDARTDPNVPPLPPHISFEQAKGDA